MKNVHCLVGWVGALLLAPFAQGQIVYSGPINRVVAITDYRADAPYTLPDAKALTLDLTGDGVADFSLFTMQPVPSSPSFVLFGARGLNGSFYEGHNSSFFSNFAAGDVLGVGRQWTMGIDGPAMLNLPGQNWWSGSSLYGNFQGGYGDLYYIGLKLQLQDGFHFAWMGLSMPTADNGASIIIHDWAYEATARVPLVVGDIGAASSPVPEPSTYGVLAVMGLAALVAVRRKKRV